uniref:Uncharacterized protein n=1 Tax=Triticum urartu TaxID=4572 RepID=A0A8R7PC67_TRIUA
MPPHLPCWSSRLLVEVSHCHRCRCLGPSSCSCRGHMFVEASRHLGFRFFFPISVLPLVSSSWTSLSAEIAG